MQGPKANVYILPCQCTHNGRFYQNLCVHGTSSKQTNVPTKCGRDTVNFCVGSIRLGGERAKSCKITVVDPNAKISKRIQIYEYVHQTYHASVFLGLIPPPDRPLNLAAQGQCVHNWEAKNSPLSSTPSVSAR